MAFIPGWGEEGTEEVKSSINNPKHEELERGENFKVTVNRNPVTDLHSAVAAVQLPSCVRLLRIPWTAARRNTPEFYFSRGYLNADIKSLWGWWW